jgi:hypothetical protein
MFEDILLLYFLGEHIFLFKEVGHLLEFLSALIDDIYILLFLEKIQFYFSEFVDF